MVAEQRYYPYGEVRWANGALPTDFSYTGQWIEEFGLHDYHARYYSSRLERFISADTIVPKPWDPQAWNRYAYVSNNPVKYVDPIGHLTESQIREYTDYDTDTELDDLKNNYSEFYQLLRKMHLGDWLYGDSIYNKVMLDDLGNLRVGGRSARELLELESSGWVLLRDFGDGTRYEAYRYGEPDLGDYYQHTVKCPPELAVESEQRVSAETAALWAIPDWFQQEIVESVISLWNGAMGLLFGAEQAVEQSVEGPPAGHARDDAVFKSYYVVDHNPTTGEQLEFLQCWVETTDSPPVKCC